MCPTHPTHPIPLPSAPGVWPRSRFLHLPPEMLLLRVPPPRFSENPRHLCLHPQELPSAISGAPVTATPPPPTDPPGRRLQDRGTKVTGRSTGSQKAGVEHRAKDPLPLTRSMTPGQSLLPGPCFLICRRGSAQNVLMEDKGGVGCVFSMSTCLMGMIPRSGVEIWGCSCSKRDLR